MNGNDAHTSGGGERRRRTTAVLRERYGTDSDEGHCASDRFGGRGSRSKGDEDHGGGGGWGPMEGTAHAECVAVIEVGSGRGEGDSEYVRGQAGAIDRSPVTCSPRGKGSGRHGARAQAAKLTEVNARAPTSFLRTRCSRSPANSAPSCLCMDRSSNHRNERHTQS